MNDTTHSDGDYAPHALSRSKRSWCDVLVQYDWLDGDGPEGAFIDNGGEYCSRRPVVGHPA